MKFLTIEQTALKFEEYADKSDKLNDDSEITNLINDFSQHIAPFDSLSVFKREFVPLLAKIKTKEELSLKFKEKANEIRNIGTVYYHL